MAVQLLMKLSKQEFCMAVAILNPQNGMRGKEMTVVGISLVPLLAEKVKQKLTGHMIQMFQLLHPLMMLLVGY